MAAPAPKATGYPHPDAGVTTLPASPPTLRERDIEALKLKKRFRAVARGIERRQLPQRLWNRHKGWLVKLLVMIVLGGGAAYAWSLHTGWPIATALKHVASFPNCAAANLNGLAPARRGEPGYWSRHDADNVGIACG